MKVWKTTHGLIYFDSWYIKAAQRWASYKPLFISHFLCRRPEGVKVVKHIEMPKAGPKKSVCHFQKLEMILKWNKQNTVRLPQKYQFLLIKHKINC